MEYYNNLLPVISIVSFVLFITLIIIQLLLRKQSLDILDGIEKEKLKNFSLNHFIVCLLGIIFLSVFFLLIISDQIKEISMIISFIAGTILSFSYWKLNQYFLEKKISPDSIIGFTLTILCISLFFNFSKFEHYNNINLLICFCLGLSIVLIFSYSFSWINGEIEYELNFLNQHQLFLIIYFWSLTAVLCLVDKIFYNTDKIYIIIPLFLGISSSIIILILKIITLKDQDESKQNFTLFLLIIFLGFIEFVSIKYFFYKNINIIYTLLIGLGTFIILKLIASLKIDDSKFNLIIQSILSISVIGISILLSNRLYGSYGISLCSLSMIMAGNYLFNISKNEKNDLLIKYISIGSILLSSRSLIQLYLYRTYLTEYGIDITQSYTFFSFTIGIIFPLILLFIIVVCQRRKILSFLGSLFTIFFPVMVGIFFHTLATAGFVIGVLISTLISLGFMNFIKDIKYTPILNLSNILSPVFISLVSITLIFAPWIIQINDLTRMTRFIIFCLILLLILILSIFYFYQENTQRKVE